MNVEAAEIRCFAVNDQQLAMVATVVTHRLPPTPAVKALKTDAGGSELASVLSGKNAA